MACNCILTPKCPECLQVDSIIVSALAGNTHTYQITGEFGYCKNNLSFSIADEYNGDEINSSISGNTILYTILPGTTTTQYLYFRVTCDETEFSALGYIEILLEDGEVTQPDVCENNDCSSTQDCAEKIDGTAGCFCNDVEAANYDMEEECVYAREGDPCYNGQCSPGFICDNLICIIASDPCENVTCNNNQTCVNGVCEDDTIEICTDCAAINKDEVAVCQYSDCDCGNGITTGHLLGLIKDAQDAGQTQVTATYSIATSLVDNDDPNFDYGTLYPNMTTQQVTDALVLSLDLWTEAVQCQTGVEVVWSEFIDPPGLSTEFAEIVFKFKSNPDNTMSALQGASSQGTIDVGTGTNWGLDDCTGESQAGVSFLWAVTHEVGHILGLDHINRDSMNAGCENSLMDIEVDSGENICGSFDNSLVNDKVTMNCLKELLQ